MDFRVEVSQAAEQDLDEIAGWIGANEAGSAGERWFLRLKDAIESLQKMPMRSPSAPESDHVDFEVRQLLFGRRPHIYRVLYRIAGGKVIILRVRHGRRRRLARV